MNEREQLLKVLSRATRLVSLDKNQDALALINKQRGRLAVHPELSKIKARALTGLGRYQASVKILQTLRVKLPRDTSVLVGLAFNLNLMKDHNAAIEYAEAAVKLEPNNIGYLLNLASTYRANKMTDSAVTVLRRAESLAPKQPNVVLLLCELLIEQGAYLEALERLQRSVDSPSKSMLMLDCFCKLNWYDKAKEMAAGMDDVVAGQGDYYKALFITRLQQLGDFSRVRQLLDGPPPLNSPQLLLCYIQSVELDADMLVDLAARLAKSEFERDQQVTLLFAISNRLFECREHERAYEYLAAANRMQSIPDRERQEINKAFDNIKRVYSGWKYEGVSGSQSNLPVFVIGLPRSGTTLVESILASHSKVFGAGETRFLDTSLNGNSDTALTHANAVKYLARMNDWDDDEIRKMADGYLTHLQQHSSDAKHIVDKMPHNFLHVGVIRKLFPNAKIIHCVRNPIANCLSIYKQHLADFHAYSTQQQYLGEYFGKYCDLMVFWKDQVEGLNLIEISYESLVTEFEPTVRRLLSDCDLDFEDNCLDFHQQKKVVITLSATQVRDKIYRTSLKSWAGQEAYIKPLLDAFPDAV